MFSLRPLIIILLVVSNRVGASPEVKTVKYNLQSQTLTGFLNSFSPDRDARVQSLDQILSASAGISDDLMVDVSLSELRRDYSEIELLQKDGSRIVLGQQFDQPEYSTALSATQVMASHQLALSYRTHMSNSPYQQRSVSLDYTYRGPYDVYKAGFKGSYSHIDQPESYYVNREFVTTKRPRYLEPIGFNSWVENVLTDYLKVRTEFLYGAREQDRPNHYGGVVKVGYAISDEYSSRISLGAIEEANSTLKDDRGRFRSDFGDIELSWLPTYQFTARIMYGLLIEKESDKIGGTSEATGHDIYGAGLSYKFKNLIVDGNIALRKTNTSIQETNFAGGLAWEL